MSICTSIEVVEKFNDSDLLKVTIDNVTEAFWIYDHAEALKYLNQEVIVDYRWDIFKGEKKQFINTFCMPTVVQTLDKHDNFRLYVDVEDNQSNVSFNEINNGETRQGCIVFCVSSEYKSSPSAQWMELIIRDRLMRVATLRLFDYSTKAVEYTGKYVMTELAKSKYGFTSELISPIAGESIPNPELEIAKKFIVNFFKDDNWACDYMNKHNIVGFLSEAVDYEVGYGLVRLAMELSMLENYHNLTKDFDLVAIGQALLCARGHVCRSSALSSSFNNVLMASQFNWPNKRLVLTLLDEALSDKPKEYTIYKSIKDSVDLILKTRKGTE